MKNGEKMLTQLKKQEFEKVYEIMKVSFPFDEIRSFKAQEKLLDHKNYKILILSKNDELYGFVAIWDFDNSVFLEHFATSSQHRNMGLGNKILNELSKYTNKKIILEVEHPTDEMATRRIEFYKRCGFKLFDFGYIMPAFSKKHKPVPLLLMSNSNMTQIDYDDFYDKIINIVNVQS